MKTIKKTLNIAVTLFVGAIILLVLKAMFFGQEIEQVEFVEPTITVIQDNSSIFDGLKDFVKKDEIKKKVELVEKEAYLNHRKEVLQEKYEKEIAEIEAELDTVRGELSVS